jgi:hypothetical protein
MNAIKLQGMTCTEISQLTKNPPKTLCFIMRREEQANKIQSTKRVVCRVTGRRAYLLKLL